MSVGEPALHLLESLAEDLSVVVVGRGDVGAIRPGELLRYQLIERSERALAERAAIDEERRRAVDADRGELALARLQPLLTGLEVLGEPVVIEAERGRNG